VLIVGGGWAMTELKPEWESVGPWIGAAVYIIVLGLALWYRFESGAWKKIQLVKPREAAAMTAADAARAERDQLKHDAAIVAPAMPGLPATDAESSIRNLAESESEAIEAQREA
jgi:hypothetical protein